MKSKFLVAFLAFSLAFVPVFASYIQESILNVDASKVTEISPDTAIIKFYVENSGINLAEIKEKNDKTVNTAMNAIKAKLSSDETVRTIAFSVNNVYSYKDKIRIFQKYEVKNGFEVKLKDLSKISEIINIAMNNGIKNIGDLSFTLADSEKACNAALNETIKIAQTRANAITGNLGVQLGKIKSINPYCSVSANNPTPRYYANSFSAKAQDAAEGSVIDSIEPGMVSIRSSVNMTYYLK